MNIDKHNLHKLIEEQILKSLDETKAAASQAYETATHQENKAENKYDTLGLEAAYLAEGQSKRVLEFEENLATFKKLNVKRFNQEMEISTGALVGMTNQEEDTKYFFISPVAGGTPIQYKDLQLMLITPTSPLGKSLIKSILGDEINFNNTPYEITHIY